MNHLSLKICGYSAVTITAFEYVVVALPENVAQVFRPAELNRPKGLHYEFTECGK